MLNLTTGQLEAWLAQYIWPFIRIGACFMAAPVFGAQFVPPRVRLFLAGAMTLIVAPLVPPPTIDDVLAARRPRRRFTRSSSASPPASRCSSSSTRSRWAGSCSSNTMGLGFAFNVDPQRGASTPVLGTALHAAGHAHVPRAERPSRADRNARAGIHDAAGRHERLRRPGAVEHRSRGAANCSAARSPSRCPA